VSVNIDLFIRKLRARHALSREEENAIRSMRWSERRFSRSQLMVRSGEKLDHSMLLMSGFAQRCKFAADGARQIVEVNIPGDFTDLHSFILKRLEHEVVAASRCDVAAVPHSELGRVSEQFPRLARVFWFQTLIDAAIHREWMLVLGKKRSRSRVAQFFCDALPFSQQELADITGMTPVHLNRSLKELRDAGQVSFRGGQVELCDPAGLSRSAQFDPNYLHIGPHEI
jgi:CRP-like cAMP-binding protein